MIFSQYFPDVVFSIVSADAVPFQLRESGRYPLHPAVCVAMDSDEFNQVDYKTRRVSLGLLAAEWPHVPVEVEDKAKVAYTLSIQHGEADRQTRGKLGGYLARVFPMLPGHKVERIVEQWRDEVAGARFVLLTDSDAMVSAMYGCSARSCMTVPNQSGSYNWDDKSKHPYRAYSPRLGWSLAVQIVAGVVVSRCLIGRQRGSDRRGFVRIFTATEDGSIRADHQGFRAWLEDQGFESFGSWYGCELEAILLDDAELVAPYLDGGSSVSWDGGDVVRIGHQSRDRSENYCFSSTSGSVSTKESHEGETLLDNGEWVSEDEAVTLYDGSVIHSEDAVYVESEGEYYREHETVETEDGSTELRDNCYRLNGRNRWAYCDDCVEVVGGGYELTEDCQELYDGEFCLTDDAVELHNGYYAFKDDANLVELHDGAWGITV